VSRRRGFALALVVLLTMVSSIAIAVLLQRQGQQNRTVTRQMRWTQERHLERGLREVIGAWLPTASQRLSDIAEGSGHALDVELPGGRLVRVEVEDAQGALLAETAALDADDAASAQSMLAALYERVPDPSSREALTRPVGPLAVSALAAPEPVLAAAAEVVLGPGAAEDLAQEIVLARADREGPGTQWLRRLFADANPDREVRAELRRLIAAETVLWRLRIQVRGDLDRQAVAEYEALVEVDGREIRRRADSGQFAPLGPFLLWRRSSPSADGSVPGEPGPPMERAGGR